MTTRTLARAALCAALCAPGAPLLAEDGRLQPDFTFRRVSVPPSGNGPRINVQIDPDAQSAIRPGNSAFSGETRPAPADVVAVVAPGVPQIDLPAPSGYEWFWAAVSPRLADTGPGRLELAIRALSSAPDGTRAPSPRIQGLQEIARVHGAAIMAETVGTRVSPALVLAVISVESAGRADAESHAGAAGLMQLMPATAERFGVTDRLDARQSIRGGVRYLDWLLGHFDGDPVLALAGYNAGEGAVRDNAGVPPYAETRGYVPKVLAAFAVARGLCQTPPVLISDGCVFAVNNL
ncbi:lytic transglycosylase domain-containing protein [Wenxinia marina]|uniref:Soluble lytic murein transglycosylase n=1 Tax=Wenxinia marina DSM 24838 TaxID=1123501 RepID=A0A0D0Q678_9RHOB|nr:lytic transglycosylase domain-containing protein [Wenxinia marina]KIQ67967.1 Soluble lytic murein transglycosylase [Wenxinia marina DSM 24838]GGL75839.1 murein transglycosylase [Wenxinia marina]